MEVGAAGEHAHQLRTRRLAAGISAQQQPVQVHQPVRADDLDLRGQRVLYLIHLGLEPYALNPNCPKAGSSRFRSSSPCAWTISACGGRCFRVWDLWHRLSPPAGARQRL